MLNRHRDLLARIERQYGVPGPVLVAIWGLESDFGANAGNMSIIRSLATLAYDCRRTEMFQGELMAALRIIDRGDLQPSEMRGAWAGEMGQTQFLATNYERFAVDFDGNGRRDLIGSIPDVLASTANYLRAYGWRAGEPWDEGTHNFQVLKEWNSAPIYQRAIALFANRLADAPAGRAPHRRRRRAVGGAGPRAAAAARAARPRHRPGRRHHRPAHPCRRGRRTPAPRPARRRARRGVPRPPAAIGLREIYKKRGRSGLGNGPSLGRKRPRRAAKRGQAPSRPLGVCRIAAHPLQPRRPICDKLFAQRWRPPIHV
jgi:hypothetical protein